MITTRPLEYQSIDTTTRNDRTIVRPDSVEIIYESVPITHLPMTSGEHKPVGILDGVNLGLELPVSLIGT